MTSAEDLAGVDHARTATLRRIGRNLVNAQRIELLLKFLLQENYSGPLASIQSGFKKHAENVTRKTLGALIPELAETMVLPGDGGAPASIAS